MRMLKKINTSAVLCVDGDGRQLVAFGKGLGFCSVGEELDIVRVQRTFYNVSPRYMALINELPSDVIEISSHITDVASGMLVYELSDNISLILADHIAYAIERAKKGVRIQIPLSYDVAQRYPVEYKIGEYAVGLIASKLGVRLPKKEAAGIALSIVNNVADAAPVGSMVDSEQFDRILNGSVSVVEDLSGETVCREGFSYARFATHLQYLYERVLENRGLDTENVELYHASRQTYPLIASCVDRISDLFRLELGCSLPDEESFYLMMHINRILSRKHDDK